MQRDHSGSKCKSSFKARWADSTSHKQFQEQDLCDWAAPTLVSQHPLQIRLKELDPFMYEKDAQNPPVLRVLDSHGQRPLAQCAPNWLLIVHQAKQVRFSRDRLTELGARVPSGATRFLVSGPRASAACYTGVRATGASFGPFRACLFLGAASQRGARLQKVLLARVCSWALRAMTRVRRPRRSQKADRQPNPLLHCNVSGSNESWSIGNQHRTRMHHEILSFSPPPPRLLP